MIDSEKALREWEEVRLRLDDNDSAELRSLLNDGIHGKTFRKWILRFASQHPVEAKTFTGNSWGNFLEGMRYAGYLNLCMVKAADKNAFYLMLQENDNG